MRTDNAMPEMSDAEAFEQLESFVQASRVDLPDAADLRRLSSAVLAPSPMHDGSSGALGKAVGKGALLIKTAPVAVKIALTVCVAGASVGVGARLLKPGHHDESRAVMVASPAPRASTPEVPAPQVSSPEFAIEPQTTLFADTARAPVHEAAAQPAAGASRLPTGGPHMRPRSLTLARATDQPPAEEAVDLRGVETPSEASSPAPQELTETGAGLDEAANNESADLQLLFRARTSLESDPTSALALLEEHEARFTNTTHVQERETLLIEALRQTGQVAQAHQRAARFLERFPTSVYARRIRVMLGQ